MTFRLETRDASSFYDLGTLLGSWTMQSGKGQPVTEVFGVLVEGDAPVNIRSTINDLEEFLENAELFHGDPLRDKSIWLRFLTDSELSKRVLINSYEKQHSNEFGTPFLLSKATKLLLALTRHPYWESVAANTASTTNLSCTGGKWDLTGTIFGGTVDSRLERLRFGNKSAGGTLARMWVGIRPPGEATSSFTPLVQCEISSSLAVDVGSFAVGDASGGSVMRIQFSDGGGVNTMGFRFTVSLGVIASTNTTHYIGRYHVLMRYKLTAASTEVGVRLSTSFVSPTQTVPHQKQEIQYLTDTNWRLAPLGTIEIPATGYRQAFQDLSGGLNNYRLNIEAERISGTGALYCDAFILIPAEHSVFIDGMSLPANYYVTLITDEDDNISCYVQDQITSGASITSVPSIGSDGKKPWGYPLDGGVVVLAAERDTAHDLNDQMSTANVMALHQRWLSYRN